MSPRIALSTVVRAVPRPQHMVVTRRSYSASTAPGPVRQFFAHGIPIECYPIIGVTACVLSFATFSVSKHVIQDKDHLRWLPGQGGVKYELKSQ